MRTAALLLLLAAHPASAAQRVEHRFFSAAPAGSVRRVIVDIPAGEVHVRNGAPDRISISGVVSREPDRDRNREAEQRIVDDSRAAIIVRGGEATIRRAFGRHARSWRAATFSGWDVVVEVPPGMHVDVRTRYGAVEVEGTFGDIDVNLRAGEVGVRIPRALVRELRASTMAGVSSSNLGDERVTREGLFSGTTRWQNPAGTTTVNVRTTFGEVRVDLTR